jgi:hypothetical protein
MLDILLPLALLTVIWSLVGVFICCALNAYSAFTDRRTLDADDAVLIMTSWPLVAVYHVYVFIRRVA